MIKLTLKPLITTDVRTINLSAGGIAVTSSAKLSPASTHRIIISDKGKYEVLLTGTVAWTSQRRNGENGIVYYDAGLKFIDLDDKKKDTLFGFISKHRP